MLEVGGTAINLADLLVGVVLLVSGLLAFARGFSRELLAIAAWIGAVAGTFLAFPYLAPEVRPIVGNDQIADVIVSVASFLLLLALLTIIAHRLAERVRSSAIGALDRTLGFFFGLVRGILVVASAYIGLAYFLPESEHPDIVVEAKALPLVKLSAQTFLSFFPAVNVPPSLGGEAAVDPFTFEDALEAGQKIQEYQGDNPNGSATGQPDDLGTEEGYNSESRSGLEQLIGTE